MAKRQHPDDTNLESKKLSLARNTKSFFDIECTLPTTLEGNRDLVYYDAMMSAFANWSVCGFKESLKHTVDFLRNSGIRVDQNGSDLCRIMGNVIEHNVRIRTEQHSHSISPKGLLLLWCIAEHFHCTVFLFSTRKQPTIIKPSAGGGVTRNFAALLVHTDSFLQRTTWFSLSRQEGFVQDSSVHKAPSIPATDDLVATRFIAGSKKARHNKTFSNDELDQKVMEHLQKEVYSAYQNKWHDFLQKKGSSKSVDDFKKTLSIKSLPNKVVSKVHVEMAKELGDLRAGWTQGVIDRLRTAKKMPTTAKYVASFIKDLNKELETAKTAQTGESSTSGSSAGGASTSGSSAGGASASGSSAGGASASGSSAGGTSASGSNTAGSSAGGASASGSSAGEAIVDSDTPTGPEDGAGGARTGGSGSDQVIRTVSRSLKAVLHPSFDSKVFFGVIKDFQASCHLCIRGLSKAVGILVNLVLSGQHEKKRKASFFDVQAVDLFDCGLSNKVKPISIINDTDASALQYLFEYGGFWKILSFCIGQKNEDKTQIPLLARIQEELDRTDYVDFTTRPALQEACRMYHTNFSNIYSKKNCQAVLRTVLTLLLKINLCRERLFGDRKKKRIYKRKPKKGPKPQSHQATKKLAMDKLFWLLASNRQVDICIEKQMKIIFSPKPASTTSAPSPVSSKGKSRMPTAASSPQSPSTTNDDPGIELFDSDDSDLESVIDDEIEEEEEEEEEEKTRDLTSKEINALVAVSAMLCTSTSIRGDISPEYLAKQLYKDKRDSIPATAVVHCCTIVNALRSLVPRDQDPPACKWLGLFELHNTLVDFLPGLTKKNPRSLFPAIDNPESSQDKMAIAIDARTLYGLFSKEYRTYQRDKSEFTSIHMITTTQAKEDLFSNFFNMPKIHKILREQKLTFGHYIKFKDLYNVHLVGVKTLGTSTSSGIKSTVNKPDPKPHVPKSSGTSSKADVSKADALSSTLKEAKKKLRPLALQLSKLQRSRMDAGHASRSYEKTNKALNWDLYSKLKEARKKYDTLWATVSSMKAQIKQMSSDLYVLNKSIHGQDQPQAADVQALPLAIDKDTVIQGTDPGLVTTASSVWCTSLHLFQSINRFQVLEDHCDSVHETEDDEPCSKFELTAKKIDNAVLSDRRKKRKRMSANKLQKGRSTRRIRLKKYHQHLVASQAKPKLISFIGNWHRNTTYIRGHDSRSLAPYLSTLSTTSKVILVDEFNSTKKCCSCFQETQKQLVRQEDGSMKRNPGAVTCFNPACPRRLKRHTTMNRDRQGAANIALIGFSALVSHNGKVLPPFRRAHNPDKYILSPLYSQVASRQNGDVTTPASTGE